MTARLTMVDSSGLELRTSAQALAAPASPATLAATYARQADELAATLERLLAVETKRGGRLHTIHTLRTVATALGEQHGQLDELAEHLGRRTG